MVAARTAYRFTVEDLERMNPQPLDDTRYEIIDGELHVSTQPHAYHHRPGSLSSSRPVTARRATA
jgi:hypothetical protein